jgi:hypothetical protein
MVGKSLIRILLISEPVEIDGCYWSKERLASQLKNSGSDSVTRGSSSTSDAGSSKIKGFFSGLTKLGGSGSTSSPADSPQAAGKSSSVVASSPKTTKDVFLQKIQNAPGSKNTQFFPPFIPKLLFLGFRVNTLRHTVSLMIFPFVALTLIAILFFFFRAEILGNVKKFLAGFINKPPVPEEQPKIVKRFIDDTMAQIAAHKLWKGANEEELDTAAEWIEKYAMLKIYNWCELHSSISPPHRRFLTFLFFFFICRTPLVAFHLQLMILREIKPSTNACNICSSSRRTISIFPRNIAIMPNSIWRLRNFARLPNTRRPAIRSSAF